MALSSDIALLWISMPWLIYIGNHDSSFAPHFTPDNWLPVTEDVYTL